MPRNAQVVLADILSATEYILKRTEGVSVDDYRIDQDLRFIVERNFILIGEAMVILKRDFPSTSLRLEEHAKSIRFRNFIVHQYWAIDHDQVWSTLITKVVPLRDAVHKLLNENSKD